MSKNHGRDGRNSGRQAEELPIPAEALDAMLKDTVGIVTHWFPDVGEAKLIDACQAAVGDLINFMTVLMKMGAKERAGTPFFSIRFDRLSPIVSRDDTAPGFMLVAPVNFFEARTLQDKFSWLGIVGFLTSPPARAVAYIDGFRPRIQFWAHDPREGLKPADVIDVTGEEKKPDEQG